MRDWASSGGAKVERAKEHIADFDRARRDFLGAQPYTVVSQFDATRKSGQLTFVVDSHQSVPARLASISADAIHNLRASLDILWNQAWTQGKAGTQKLYFPLAKNAKEFEARFATVKQAHYKAAVNVLRKVEPWNKLLHALNEIDNKDKHEMPILAAAIQKKLLIKLPPDLAIEGKTGITLAVEIASGYAFLEPGKDLGTGLTIETDAGPLTAAECLLTADIAFGRSEFLEGQPVLEVLNESAKIVEGAANAFLAAGLLK